jgi:hypothetical protein
MWQPSPYHRTRRGVGIRISTESDVAPILPYRVTVYLTSTITSSRPYQLRQGHLCLWEVDLASCDDSRDIRGRNQLALPFTKSDVWSKIPCNHNVDSYSCIVYLSGRYCSRTSKPPKAVHQYSTTFEQRQIGEQICSTIAIIPMMIVYESYTSCVTFYIVSTSSTVIDIVIRF